MSLQPTLVRDPASPRWELDPASRTYRLREMYWAKAHESARITKPICGCGEDTLVGHARDFAALLAASDPTIQPYERIVGCSLAVPEDPESLNLGHYDRHYPPGFELLLRKGLTGIRDEARARQEVEDDPERREFLRAVEIAYDAACQYVGKHVDLAHEMAAAEPDPVRRRELEDIAEVCQALTVAAPASFRAALQLFQFARLFGGRGCIGRFDQWLYPYYRRDIDDEVLTQEEAPGK